MTLGGLMVVGTTVLIAMMDGGLTALVVASAMGGGTYILTRRAMNALPQKVAATQKQLKEAELQTAIDLGVSGDELKALKKRLSEELEQIKEEGEGQKWGNKEMAAAIGVASFACPPLGLITLGALTRRHWAPVFVTLGLPEQAGHMERTGAIRKHFSP